MEQGTGAADEGLELQEFSRRDLLRRAMMLGGAVLGGGVAADVLAACGGGGSSERSQLTLSDVENASGTIKMLGWQPYRLDKDQNGRVRAQWSYLTSSTEIPAKIRPHGSFDVINSNTLVMPEIIDTHRLVELDTGLIPNYESIASGFRNNPIWRSQGKIYAVPYQIGPTLIGFNASTVPEPKSAQQLLSSVYRGRIGLNDDPTIVIPHIARILGLKKGDPSKLTPAELDQITGYLKKLKPQVKTIFEFGDEKNLLARGDIAVALDTYPFLIGANLKGVRFSLWGSYSFADGLSIVSGGRVAASYQWINRMISSRAERAVTETGAIIPVVESATNVVPTPLDLPLDKLARISPILGAPPATTRDGIVGLNDWSNAWNSYKASFH